MKLKGFVKKYYPFFIAIIIITLILVIKWSKPTFKRTYVNVSKFTSTSSFVNVTSPIAWGPSFVLQKWNGGTSYSTLNSNSSGQLDKIPTTNVPNYNIVPASSWSWFDSSVTSSTAKFLGIDVSGTKWFVKVDNTPISGTSFTEYNISFSTTEGSLFNVVTQSARSTPLTFTSNIYNRNYLYKVDGSSSNIFLCVAVDSLGAYLMCANPDEPNTTVLTYNFLMLDNSVQNVNTIVLPITSSDPFWLGIWNGPGSTPEWNILSDGGPVSGQYKPNYDKNFPDPWFWVSDSSGRTDDISKYLAVSVVDEGGTLKYIKVDSTTGVVTLNEFEGTLFNVVTQSDRYIQLNILNSINDQNYLYKVKGPALETYLAVTTDATDNLLMVVTMGSGDIKSYNFKMYTGEPIDQSFIKTIVGNITYSSEFLLGIWNGPESTPEWNILSAGVVDTSGNYKPNYAKNPYDKWVWVSDDNTNQNSKYLAVIEGGEKKYINVDYIYGIVTLSTTQGTLFNVVPSIGDRSIPLDILGSIDNENYLLYKVKGSYERYLAVTTDDTDNLLMVVTMGVPGIKSYNFKMYTNTVNIDDICELFVTTNVLTNYNFITYIMFLEMYRDASKQWTNIYKTPDLTPIDYNSRNNIILIQNNIPKSIGYMKYGNPVKFYFYYPVEWWSSVYRFIEFDYKNTFIPTYPNKPPNALVKIINKKIFVNITDPLFYYSNGERNYEVIQARADIYIDVTMEYTDISTGVKTYETENVKIMST